MYKLDIIYKLRDNVYLNSGCVIKIRNYFVLYIAREYYAMKNSILTARYVIR